MLCTPAQVAQALGYDLTPAQTQQIMVIIRQVSSAINSYCQKSWGATAEQVVTMQADEHGKITLRSTPVTDVTFVKDVEGVDNGNWTFDGTREISGLEGLETVTITYTHVPAMVPDDVRDVALAMATRQSANPAGIRQETVGSISVTYASTFGNAGSITPSALEQMVLDRYRETEYSLRL